jgi:2-methylisocitrate lyase-like PEP mutase family enzyme
VGFACAMIEDQVAPKRCGHTPGKEVVDREEACDRIRAAVEVRDEGADILIMARTDARSARDMEEALVRARAFSELGADILFVEAPATEEEMRRLCAEAPGRHMANMVEGGVTPILPPRRLEEIGYKIAAYPLTLLSTAARAMNDALAAIARGDPAEGLLGFPELRTIVGFDTYDAALARFGSRRRSDRGE